MTDAITGELGPLEQRRTDLRDEAARLAVDLLKAGEPPTVVALRVPFSDAHLRKLARDAGIPPARTGGGAARKTKR